MIFQLTSTGRSMAPSSSHSPAPSSVSAQPSAASPPAAKPSSLGGGNAFGRGISYSPYDANSGCRTPGEIHTDLAGLLVAAPYDLIRVYGTDCNQVASALDTLAHFPGVRLFAGIWSIEQANDEAGSIIAQVAGRWHLVHTVNVGNEAVDQGRAAPGAVAGAVNSVRGQLRAAGYGGPVVAVDTMSQMATHPELCGASDYCAFNCHSFFDSHAEAGNAGPWVQDWVNRIEAVANGKMVVVTETGWPVSSSLLPYVTELRSASELTRNRQEARPTATRCRRGATTRRPSRACRRRCQRTSSCSPATTTTGCRTARGLSGRSSSGACTAIPRARAEAGGKAFEGHM